MRRAAAACALVLTACAPLPTARESGRESHAVATDREREDTRQSLFLAMVKPDACYQGTLDYGVRDADFLDRVLTRLLAGKNLDDLIVSDRTYTSSGVTHEIARLLREAPGAYASELRTQDGLARVARIIADRFARPRIEMSQGIVMVDYAHVGANLTLTADGKIVIDFNNSPHLNQDREWQTAEVAAALEEQLEKHPNALGVRLRVLIPGGSRPAEWFYTYTRVADRIRVFWGDNSMQPLQSPVLGHDFTPYRSGARSLSTRLLQPGTA